MRKCASIASVVCNSTRAISGSNWESGMGGGGEAHLADR